MEAISLSICLSAFTDRDIIVILFTISIWNIREGSLIPCCNYRRVSKACFDNNPIVNTNFISISSDRQDVSTNGSTLPLKPMITWHPHCTVASPSSPIEVSMTLRRKHLTNIFQSYFSTEHPTLTEELHAWMFRQSLESRELIRWIDCAYRLTHSQSTTGETSLVEYFSRCLSKYIDRINNDAKDNTVPDDFAFDRPKNLHPSRISILCHAKWNDLRRR